MLDDSNTNALLVQKRQLKILLIAFKYCVKTRRKFESVEPTTYDATKLFLRVKKTDFLRLNEKANEDQALNYYFVIVLIILKSFSSNHRIRNCFPIAGVAKKRSLNFSFCTQEVSVFIERRPLHAYNLRIFIESLNVK